MSRYEKEKVIGSGTFGSVWLVKSKLSRHAYVLKEINISTLNEDEQRQAYTEASALAKCKHKNIIRYKETVLAENKYLQIIMEYAEGGDLYTAILNQKGVPFSDHRIISWFIQICLALQYIHMKNIIHRDLKTQNIFLTRSKAIKIGDFGIARILSGPDELAKTAIGTPYYLSPEILQRNPYNFKSDMWALGCVLFEMAALEHAFKAKDFVHLASLVLRCERRKLPPNRNLIIEFLVESLLRINPEERPSSDEILKFSQLQPYLSQQMSSPRENLLREENGSRRRSLDAFRAASLNLSKRRNSLTSGQSLGLKRGSSSSENPGKSRSALNNAFIKRYHKSTTKQYDVSCKIKDKTFSVRLGKMDPGMSPDTYVLCPEAGARLTKSDDSLNGSFSKSTCTKTCGRSISTGSYSEDIDKQTIPKTIDSSYEEAGESIFDDCQSNSTQICDSALGETGKHEEGYESSRRGISDAKIGNDSAFNTQSDGSDFDKTTSKVNDSLFSFNRGLANPEDKSTPKSLYEITFDLPEDGASAFEDDFAFQSHNNQSTLDQPEVSSTVVENEVNCLQDSPVHTHCSHAQCHQCMLDMLWKNRIRGRVDKAIDEDEYQRLKKQLLLVFKVDLFERVRHSLISDWEESEDAKFKSKFKQIVKTLNYEQVQSLPLMMQLIQLDLLARNQGRAVEAV